jgi:hypothetical protein
MKLFLGMNDKLPRTSDYESFSHEMLLVLVIPLILCVYIAIGAVGMFRLRHYRRAKAASILAILVCALSPMTWITVWFGVWALVVLNRDNVRLAFAERERRQAPPRPPTPSEWRLGMAGVMISLAGFPLLAIGLAVASKIVTVAFVALEAVGLIYGALGRRSRPGRIGFGLAITAFWLLPFALVFGYVKERREVAAMRPRNRPDASHIETSPVPPSSTSDKLSPEPHPGREAE